MTLAELAIVVAMLAILAAILVPMFGSTSDMARTEAMASNAVQVRSMILQHASTRDVPLSAGGFPTTVQATWFKIGHLPEHAWTGHSLQIETVGAAANVIYPASKTFDPRAAGVPNAWYNTTNGRFCVRIPAQSNTTATLQLFNDVNKCAAKTLAQTTE